MAEKIKITKEQFKNYFEIIDLPINEKDVDILENEEVEEIIVEPPMLEEEFELPILNTYPNAKITDIINSELILNTDVNYISKMLKARGQKASEGQIKYYKDIAERILNAENKFGCNFQEPVFWKHIIWDKQFERMRAFASDFLSYYNKKNLHINRETFKIEPNPINTSNWNFNKY